MVLKYSSNVRFERHTNKKDKKREEGVVRFTKFIAGKVIENIRGLKTFRWCPLVLLLNDVEDEAKL